MATTHQRHMSMIASLLLIGVLCLIDIVPIPTVAAASATLVQTIKTGASGSWGPLYSPDPAGITYWPAKNRLVIVDSEVDEMTIWAGANVFESTLQGQRGATYNIKNFTREPAGIDIDVAPNGHFWISDDGQQRVFDVNLGSDGQFRTSDDTVRTISVAFDSDPEGLTLATINGEMQLFLADGKGKKIWRCRFGQNGVFDGGGDDIITSINVLSIGISDPEGLDYDADRGTFWVIDHLNKKLNEVTISGQLLQTFDLAAIAGAFTPADVTVAPGSQSGTSLYIVDRGVDNNDDPSENDGKIYEIKVPDGSPPPVSNRLANPDFEDDANNDGKPDAWSTSSKFTRSNMLVHGGAFAGKFLATDNSDVTITQSVAGLTAGATYNFSGWVNIPAQNDTTFTFKIQVQWKNASNGTISTTTVKSYTAATSGWNQATKSMVAPAGTVSALVKMVATSLNGNIFVDDFAFS